MDFLSSYIRGFPEEMSHQIAIVISGTSTVFILFSSGSRRFSMMSLINTVVSRRHARVPMPVSCLLTPTCAYCRKFSQQIFTCVSMETSSILIQHI